MSRNKSSASTAKNTLDNLKVLISCLVLIAASIFAFNQAAIAKAYHATLKEMIDRCDAIALGYVGPVKQIKEKGQPFEYSQESSVNLIQTIKGSLPKTFTLRGGENFICAQVHFTEGKNLLFLKKENDYFKGANWDSSCLQVNNDKVRWFNNMEERHASVKVSLDAAIKEIKDIMSGNMVSMKLPDYLNYLLNASQFADHIRGEAPQDKPEWVAYTNAKANSSTIKKELAYLVEKGTPAGKLYGACALMASDKKLGLEYLNKLKTNDSEVLYVSGCRGTNESLGRIAKSLVQSGKFLNFSLDK
ncbi:MAG: hypothetical protein SFY67_00135 [Candidatus Melainabacteria bacterium]|nr:hypothetical protein [Candidatus Melainabacteria bacterium]